MQPGTAEKISDDEHLPAFSGEDRRSQPEESSERMVSRAMNFFRHQAEMPLPDALALHTAPDAETIVPGDALNFLPNGELSDEAREAYFTEESARLFRLRLRLVLGIVLFLIPFLVIYTFFDTSPSAQIPTFICYGVLSVLSAAALYITDQKLTLWQVRLLSIVVYITFSGTASGLMILASDSQSLIHSGHTQILFSLLIMPYTVVELGIISMIVVGAYAGALQWALPPDRASFYLPYVGALTLNAILIFLIGHFQSVLRRIAFVRSLEMACLAARSQALSILDPVTGGFNRRHLLERLEVELVRAKRLHYATSVLMFDLDNFKAVNDQRGHQVGDEVLRQVWHATADTLRRTDLAGRYGGDEFIIVLPQADNDAASLVAQRLCAAAGQRLIKFFGGDSLESKVTLSVGVVTQDPKADFDVDDLIRRADERLYAAKRQGKNCAVAA